MWLILTFADDSSITIEEIRNNCKSTSEKIDNILSKLEVFLKLHNLKLNISKTVLLRVTTRQQIAWNKGEHIKLESKNEKGENIVPSTKAKILGITFKNNLTWTYLLTLGKDAIVNRCKRKLGALKHVAKNASFSYRKRLADGCIMSVLTYGIQVWGLSVKKTTMNQVQIVQNMAAGWILRMPW